MNQTLPVSRRRRVVGAVFWTIAILVTAIAWSGLSLKELLAAAVF
jgi:hypothetical protein